MSANFHLRKDKHCLNCGHFVPDTYCSHCGQPNTEPRLTLADIFHDFIHMLTHFDGKFFQTVRILFTRPGYLTRAYLDGKRKQFLPPVQMYVFTSALFFFIFYSFMIRLPDAKQMDVNGDLNKKGNNAFELSFTGTDSLVRKRLNTPEAYIKYQDSLPKAKRDPYIARLFKVSEIKINKRISEDGAEALRDLINNFVKNFPKLLFLSLPLMALLLKLQFFRRKSFTYVSHILFIIHLYVFTLIAILLAYTFNMLSYWTHWSIFNWLMAAMIIWIFYYGYRSMRNLYGLKKGKGIAHYSFFLIFGFVIIVLLFMGDLVYTILTV